MQAHMPNLPIAVLISGGGTTLRNLLVLQRESGLPVDFRLVISSRASAGGLEYARDANIESQVISRRKSPSPEAHSEAIFQLCRARGVELVVMGGYLEHLLIPDDFINRVINIHPSLIPAFCGHGFYGLRVHQAALDYGVKLSGCTVHFVDNQFDHGPIIAQRACQVLPDDTAESLQARVFELECGLYPETIAAIAAGRVSVVDRRVCVRP
ncbi:MAG: phosphoribosylglycinamide formyltransferase [Aureliella sp.]